MQTLSEYLGHWAGNDGERQAVATVVRAMAAGGARLARVIAGGPLSGDLAGVIGGSGGGDQQKLLDFKAHQLFTAALMSAPVHSIASEESDEPKVLNPDAPLVVAVDPLDGSSNIDVNVSIGTIFSVLPATGQGQVLQLAGRQLAAGFIIYGPQTTLVFTTGEGTHVATLDPEIDAFVITSSQLQIAAGKCEFAVNMSNSRFWSQPVKAYVDDCLAGAEGPRGSDYNMRWIASLVAEAFRILMRGGVFLYPADRRPGYEEGRLRLVYEARPIAMLIEQAGGMATDGMTPILNLPASHLHQRTSLVFGDAAEVERVARYHIDPPPVGYQQPLFGQRGLFRA